MFPDDCSIETEEGSYELKLSGETRITRKKANFSFLVLIVFLFINVITYLPTPTNSLSARSSYQLAISVPSL